MSRLLLITVFIHGVRGQFPDMFAQAMAGGQTGSGSSCITASISCMPWCRRTMSSTGCPQCQCGSGQVNPMSGMFRGMMGGMNPMGGRPGLANQQVGKDCDPAPTTCPVPPPWCQRIIDEHHCVKCICGSELQKYLQTLNGITNPLTTTTVSSATSSKTDAMTTTVDMTTTSPIVTSPPLAKSCLDTFFCTKVCDNGYQTDAHGCPVCSCIIGGLVDTPVIATDPPGKFMHRSTTVAGHVTTCPGIFDCSLICDNGYQTDVNGCPVCTCAA